MVRWTLFKQLRGVHHQSATEASLDSRCQTGEEVPNVQPVRRQCTMQRRSSVMEGASIRPASSAWAAERGWTAQQLQRTSLRFTASPVMARSTGQKATDMGKELELWALILLDGMQARSLTTPAHDQPHQIPLPTNFPRSLEAQIAALAAPRQSTQQRRWWEQGSPGIKLASAAPCVVKAWSQPQWQIRTESCTVKFAMPKTSAPKDLDWGTLQCWKNRSRNTSDFNEPPAHHAFTFTLNYVVIHNRLFIGIRTVMLKTGYSVLVMTQCRIKLFCYIKMDSDAAYLDRVHATHRKAELLCLCYTW